jgi:hypothetical protein
MVKTFIGALTFGLAIATFAATGQAAENDCTIATKGDNGVVKGCKEGGIKRAKAVMKAMTKVANEKGMKVGGGKVECDSCHKNETDWKLTDNGQKDFEKMLELTK